jgi:DMSO/TMAO reductase YedYZ molybdopterin-dependent catalytic subunit/cytochrome b561
MSPRFTDWSIALAISVAFATGVVSLFSGHPDEWFVFALHGIAGLWLLLLLWGKLRRVWPRLISPRRWDRWTVFGVLATLSVVLAIASGIWWVGGGDVSLGWFNLLGWHIAVGFALTAVVFFHVFARARRLRKRDVIGRRRLLHFAILFLGGVALWPVQQFAEHVLNLPGARRRFTGSHESGSYAGNAFPTSSWVADQPRPIDVQIWSLSVGGAVRTPRRFSYEELSVGDGLEAVLDCTSGFYSVQHWRGIYVGRILDDVGLQADARYVRFVSVTSYRWSLPLGEARGALLATHVGGEVLSYGHGFPLRLVAPGHRGMEWVKWVVGVEVLTAPDPGQLLSIFTSSFTSAGRGD